jgi:hypothetical protein
MPKYLFRVYKVTKLWTYVVQTAESEDDAYFKILERANAGDIYFDVRNSSTVSFDIDCVDVVNNNV